ncbi:hypothetical protein B566_EDAN003629 [Ephemera danica]|nr:hypothetical protein B566_EDAN003629 [Ephemera danica]
MARSQYFFIISVLISTTQGQVFHLANMYADEMVLQMEPKSAHIWGWGEPGSQVTVTLDLQQISVSISNAEGKWSARLPPQPAGGPRTLGFEYEPQSGLTETLNLAVYFGDVWVCSGQSNMEMQLREIFNATEEIEIAATYTNIRILKLSQITSDVELDELNGTAIPWSRIDTMNIPNFSAACVLYGERMSDGLGGTRPIGLIEASWPGTRIEATNRNADNVLWNGMIHPLTALAVRGAVWYQGENNVGYNENFYACHIQHLVSDWAKTFVDGTVPAENGLAFPFGIFQLGPSDPGSDSKWGFIRWHQTVDSGALPNTFIPEAFIAVESITVTSPGVVKLSYDSDIFVQAFAGFSYQLPTGEWIATDINSVSGRDVTVTFDPTATHLAYAWESTVCEYKECAIYSADAEVLPAPVWLWSLTN